MVYINELKELNISDMIYEIRGKQVMLDSDLAKIYECANGTKSINLAVKRNIERFPEEFYFQLTMEEVNGIYSRFQIETLNKGRGSNIKYLPYVFTEQGVAMLSSVLHTEKAIKTSIQIINAFVSMRHYLSNNLLEQKYINNLVLENNKKLKEHDNSIKLLEDLFEENKEFFFDKEYDAYSKVLDIFKKVKNSVINKILKIIKV